MTTFFTIDRANARIPEVRGLLLLLRSQRDELIELRDRYVALGGLEGVDPRPGGASEGPGPGPGGSASGSASGSDGGEDAGRQGEASAAPAWASDAAIEERSAARSDGHTPAGLERAEFLRLRMKGIIDQMGASVARIDEWGITLRDIGTGLIDFPALVGGRQVWLCWRLGENEVGWWHELDDGIAGRRRLADLVGVGGPQ